MSDAKAARGPAWHQARAGIPVPACRQGTSALSPPAAAPYEHVVCKQGVVGPRADYADAVPYRRVPAGVAVGHVQPLQLVEKVHRPLAVQGEGAAAGQGATTGTRSVGQTSGCPPAWPPRNSADPRCPGSSCGSSHGCEHAVKGRWVTDGVLAPCFTHAWAACRWHGLDRMARSGLCTQNGSPLIHLVIGRALTPPHVVLAAWLPHNALVPRTAGRWRDAGPGHCVEHAGRAS